MGWGNESPKLIEMKRHRGEVQRLTAERDAALAEVAEQDAEKLLLHEQVTRLSLMLAETEEFLMGENERLLQDFADARAAALTEAVALAAGWPKDITSSAYNEAVADLRDALTNLRDGGAP